MFKPIDKVINNQPNRYYEKIIESIRNMMINGTLSAGGKLPPERELAEMFNVSRVPVREALKVLEYLGVIQNIRGDGMYLQNIDVASLIDKIDFAIETSGDTIQELFEVREALETKAAKLAAIRRTEKDIMEISKTITEMEQKIQAGQDVMETSHRFHSAVIKAAKNKVLYSVYEYLNEFLRASKEVTMRHAGRPKKSLEFHKMILERIIEQDAEGATNCMLEHLLEAEYSIKKQEQLSD
jgi:GntR family transcriptional repressor for pyruvate dehydrogenase complex